MNTVDEVERQFRALHDQSVEQFGARVKRWRNFRDEESKLAQADEREMRESLKKSGVELDLLDRRARRAADALEKRLDASRPRMLDRASFAVTDRKQRALESAAFAETPSAQIPPYAVSLMVSEIGRLEGIGGESAAAGDSGGGWIFPENPGQIRVKATSKGDGWGCWATAAPPPDISTVWFTFVPNITGRWELSPIAAFHGFYILRADDGIFTCKSARVELKARLDVLQYHWKGAKSFDLIDIDKDDVNTEAFYDRTEFFWDTVTLRAGDPVWVKLELWVDTAAAGGGSYAEINFADGAANYIEPLLMSAQMV